jgi:hypothetical protein
MLELLNPTAMFMDYVHSRVEHHGDDLVPAIDVALTWTTNNRALDDVAAGLRDALFTTHATSGEAKKQKEMDLPVDELPHLRAPTIAPPIKLEFEMEGATFIIENGIKDDSAVTLGMCKVHKMRARPIEGGSVELKFIVSSASDITASVVGELSMKQQTEVSAMLRAPKVAGSSNGEQRIDDPPPPTAAAKRSRKAAKEAGEIFAEQHGSAA